MNTAGTGQLIVAVFIGSSAMAGTPDSWLQRTSPSSNSLNGVAYGNGLFLGVGENSTILTSSDGRIWSQQSLETTVPTLRCAAFGNGRYVVGGGEAALISSSTDGIHWTNGLSTIGAESISSIICGFPERPVR